MNTADNDGEPRDDVVLLSDDPSDADEFSAKAHENVAAAIARLVTSETPGKVIGLEGPWGSGKSTIVRLLSARLRTPQDTSAASETHAVIFDAWAHEGDPLRRTFLEAIIGELAAVTGCLTRLRPRSAIS